MDEFSETYLVETRRNIGNPISSGPANYSDAQTIIKQQLTQIKLLTNDNQIKEQQVEILKDKIRECEDFNSIYKKQVENLEHKLRLYDQELTTKIQANKEKNQKFQSQSTVLARRNEELQNNLIVAERKRQIAEEQLFQVSREIQEVRNQNQETQENLEKLKGKLRKRESESKSIKSSNEQLVRELEEVHKQLQNMIGDKERMIKLNEDYERQLRQFQMSFRDLQQQQEIERSEANLIRQNLEQMKKKYDELFYDYNLLVLNKRNDEELDYLKMKIQELENALHETKGSHREKEQEIEELREKIFDTESKIKEQQIAFDNDIKKALGLLDGKTIYKPTEPDHFRSKTFHTLIEDILEFNKEQLKFENRIEELTNELSTQREKYHLLTEEQEELQSSLEEQKKQSETVLLKLNNTLNESHIKTTENQMMFDQQIDSIIKESRQNEERLRTVIKEKEEENERIRNMVTEQLTNLTSLEEEKDKAYEFLRQQGREVKEFKQRFKQIAEETSICKSRVNICVYLIGNLLKLFFNLHSKYDCLAYQKSVLAPILENHLKIRSQFVTERKGQTSDRQGKYHIYLHFRRLVNAVIAVNRLQSLGLRNINVKSLDLKAIKAAVTGLKDEQFSFYDSLYKLNTFVIDKNFLNRIFDSVCRTFVDDEYGLLFDMLSIGVQLRKFNFEKSSSRLGFILKADGINTVSAVYRLIDESKIFSEKSAYQKQEIRELEAVILETKKKADEDIDQIALQLKDTFDENERLIKDREALAEEFEVVTRQVEALLNVLRDRKTSQGSERDIKETMIRDGKADLIQELNILAKYIDDLHNENEVKNLKIIQLQKMILNANDSNGDEENWVKNDRQLRLLENSDRDNKIPIRSIYPNNKSLSGKNY